MLAARVLLGWCNLVARRQDLAQRRATLTSRFTRQRLGARFCAWRHLCQRHAQLRSILAACRAAAQRRALARWRGSAAQSATSARQRAAADRHYRRRLLLAALAHWRYLHVARSLGRVWEAALEKRHALALAGRALRVWHFYARRCRQLIKQLTSQRAAAAASECPGSLHSFPWSIQSPPPDLYLHACGHQCSSRLCSVCYLTLAHLPHARRLGRRAHGGVGGGAAGAAAAGGAAAHPVGAAGGCP